MRHAGLTCGFVFRLDKHAMLSGSPGTIDGRAQASSHWARLLSILLLTCISLMLSSNMSHARPAKDPMNYKLYAHNQLQDWDQFLCLVRLYEKESNWRPNAKNGSHYGIPQGRSKWLATADAYAQIRWGIKYIANRHGTPCKALRHFKRVGWH